MKPKTITVVEFRVEHKITNSNAWWHSPGSTDTFKNKLDSVNPNVHGSAYNKAIRRERKISREYGSKNVRILQTVISSTTNVI